VEVIQFTDGPTNCEVWELPDAGWDDWAGVVDRFLAHAIRGITVAYTGEPVEWLEVNHWQESGRLIVFPSQDGPHGDRGERVCFELSSKHLEAASRRIGEAVPEAEQETAWAALAERVWLRVGECFAGGEAAAALAAARQSHRLRVAGYDYNSGEGPQRLTETGAFAAR
jgi:hypothetical protein